MQIVLILGFVLVLIGLWCMLTMTNIVKIIIGFSIIDTGVHIILVYLGYVKKGAAPIFDKDLVLGQASQALVDPVPSALVLTAIVIGMAVTALMLSYAVKMYKQKKSLSIQDYKEQKW